MKAYKIEIAGMGCAHCVRGVTEALETIGAKVNACEIGFAEVSFDGEVEMLRNAVEDRGFDVTAIAEI